MPIRWFLRCPVRLHAAQRATIGVMGTVLLVLVVVLVVAALVFGVISMLSGDDPGLRPAEPDSRAVPLPNDRSLTEDDIKGIRFDVALRGYRMTQVDRALRRTAYDIGYKDEMIAVLEAEVAALREGRIEDADLLRKAREAAANPVAAEASAREDAPARESASEPEDAQPVAPEGETHAPELDLAEDAAVADNAAQAASDAPGEETTADDGPAEEPGEGPPATAGESAETPAEQARG